MRVLEIPDLHEWIVKYVYDGSLAVALLLSGGVCVDSSKCSVIEAT